MGKDLNEVGQAHTFLVKRTNGSDGNLYVLKRLKNLDRKERFDREIRACMELNHLNILHIVDYTSDSKGRPFLVSEYLFGRIIISQEGSHRGRGS